MALMLLAGCQHDAGQGLVLQDDGMPNVDVTAATDADVATPARAGNRRFSGCGASFDIPGDWVPEQRAAGHWLLDRRMAAGRGLKAAVRCLPDQVIAPGTQFTEIDAVRDVLGYGPDTLYLGTSEYRGWVDGLPERPGVIALHQAEDHGPGRIEVAVWEDPNKRSPDDPPSKSQGLIEIRWSDDDPQQVAQYTALRTQITSSFSAPLPESGYDRTRSP
ncbi:hypothetical protein [Luteimonas terrae]|uniref:Uncharacterized protein n=1 Tax=Luteimonas terrae TaxID=1530191 RepID=A0ABU1XWX4_9GAMM|nr:hypothetical protein [Luteimonas terrae]MDR7193262.1 hypothetical protein [Luteimonas terrae]